MCETTKQIEMTPKIQRELLEITVLATSLCAYLKEVLAKRGHNGMERRHV